jgi:hypothetical protein
VRNDIVFRDMASDWMNPAIRKTQNIRFAALTNVRPFV